MNEQELFSERMNGLLDLAMDKGGILSKGEIHFYLKDVLQSEEQYEFVYQFFAEKGVRVEGWRAMQSGRAGGAGVAPSGDTDYGKIEDFTGLMGTYETADGQEEYGEKTKSRSEEGGKRRVPESEIETYGEGDGLESGIDDYGKKDGAEIGHDSREAMEVSEFDVPDADDEYDEETDESDDADTEELPLPAGIDDSFLTEDEKRYLKYYQADMEQIEPMTDVERNSLLNALAAGDPSVMNRLVEGHLYLVMEEIRAYMHAGVPVSDLIQEASIGLIEGIQSYHGMNFEAHVRYAIREALDAITEEQQASDSVSKHLLDSIARADEATRRLSEKLDRTPTKEELAEYLHMDVEEVETILKHSIDALTVSVSDEAYGKTEEEED